jgi:hypothetical protein
MIGSISYIEERLCKIPGVKSATIMEPPTVPLSMEAFVEGGSDEDIARCIFENKPIGIATVGTLTVSLVEEFERTIHPNWFSRIFLHKKPHTEKAILSHDISFSRIG